MANPIAVIYDSNAKKFVLVTGALALVLLASMQPGTLNIDDTVDMSLTDHPELLVNHKLELNKRNLKGVLYSCDCSKGFLDICDRLTDGEATQLYNACSLACERDVGIITSQICGDTGKGRQRKDI